MRCSPARSAAQTSRTPTAERCSKESARNYFPNPTASSCTADTARRRRSVASAGRIRSSASSDLLESDVLAGREEHPPHRERRAVGLAPELSPLTRTETDHPQRARAPVDRELHAVLARDDCEVLRLSRTHDASLYTVDQDLVCPAPVAPNARRARDANYGLRRRHQCLLSDRTTISAGPSRISHKVGKTHPTVGSRIFSDARAASVRILSRRFTRI